ncbi:sensor histidine kinase [Streptococcus marmotae]|uniref:sensor histidine kinase n=1 Tax=Streptococcus marmotae TaxID=1825069 RepID=UPI00082CB460|nr:HAMP domain-containing sensor histidine kinase [Streptococcus marmotae]
MGNTKSLTYLISKYAILELLYTLLVIVSFFLSLNFLINRGWIYPANHADRVSSKIGTAFQDPDWTPTEVPFYYDILYVENGEVLKNTIEKRFDDQVIKARKDGQVIGDEIIGSRVFKFYQVNQKELVLSYTISVIPTSEKMYRFCKNFEVVYLTTFFAVWLLGFAGMIIRSSGILKKEIRKISEDNDHIKNMELDYERSFSQYEEIDGVLQSLDILSRDLKETLSAQWDMQMRQKEMIEAVTHDIRTPITLIRGNIELLQEDYPDLSSERVSDIVNGMERLESYIEKLKHFSYLIENKKEEVRAEVLDYWIALLSSMCRANGVELSILQREKSLVQLDKEAIAVALQNLLTNAMEHSDKGSCISVSFCDSRNEFSILVRDEGSGFDRALLPVLTKKFISSKTSEVASKHGLGLSIVNKIVTANNGKLYLSNRVDAPRGAEVKMVFQKEMKA